MEVVGGSLGAFSNGEPDDSLWEGKREGEETPSNREAASRGGKAVVRGAEGGTP